MRFARLAALYRKLREMGLDENGKPLYSGRVLLLPFISVSRLNHAEIVALKCQTHAALP
jgi:hypothetical protein